MNKKREELLQEMLQEISRAFRSTIFHHPRHPNHHFDKPDLNRPQLGILFFLKRQTEGVSVKDLAREFGVTSGAITQIVDSLVEKGFVSRTEDPTDRRVLKITLPDKVRDKFASLRATHFRRFTSVFEALNDQEIKQLTTVLKKIGVRSQTEGTRNG